MIFIFLNVILVAYLILKSMNVKTGNQNAENSAINIMLLDCGAALALLLAVLSANYGPEKLTIGLHHLELLLVAFVFIEISLMFLTATKKKKSVFSTIFRIVFGLLAFHLIFFKVQIKDPVLFEFDSNPIFGDASPFSWIQLLVLVYVFVLPLFSLLIMLLNGENYNSRITIQRALFGFGSLTFGWLGLFVIYYIANIIPMMRSLFMYIIAVMSIMLIESMTQEKVLDGKMIFSKILSMIVKYFIPAAIGAFIYVALRPILGNNYVIYSIVVAVAVFLLMLLGRGLSSALSKLIRLQSSHYEADFERALAAINYESELSNISLEFFKAFQDNLQTTTMSVIVDSGSGDYTTAFNSENKTYSIPKLAKPREVLINNDLFIIFRNDIETNYLLQPIMTELDNLFEETESEAMIILHEGHTILGFLFLGERRTGGSYDEYDRQVFDKFYSYFFVYGYYMKNIANASVVGTVNREIRMSSQIITSIQENMDYIKNPKIDIGYLMVPAHNIGGEFVDLIRLNDTSHIMVIGSLSGKGISASMSMVILKSIIRTFLADTHDFKKLVQKVNAFIRANLPKGTFFSGIFCLIDFAADTMYYINCGIPTMLMYSKTYNNVIEIQGKGYVLGFVKDVTPLVKVKEIKLIAGDMLAVSTNGLINSHSLRGEQFGKERIKQTLLDNYTYPATRITKFAYDNLQRFMSKELEDDITMVVIRYFGNDTSMYIEDDADNAQERLIDHADSFDADALLADAMGDTVVTASSDEVVEPSESMQEEIVEDTTGSEEVPVSDIVGDKSSTDAIIEESTDFDISSVFDDDMFNADFSNPNAGISVDDIVETDFFDEKEKA